MNQNLHMITCSYGPDFQRAQRLCESVDRYVPDHIGHTLIVPRRDLPQFAPLAHGRRKVVATEDVFPGRLHHVPGLKRWWVDGQGWPMRGWIVQQLTKMCADRVTDAEFLLFADSDLQFIRPFREDMVVSQGRLRLHRVPGAKRYGVHGKWHRQAGKLLGTARTYGGADYVGQLVTWRRSHLIAMKAHMASVSGQPWHQSFGRSLRVSEYILYGTYVDKVVPFEDRGHWSASNDLCHCCWFADQAEALAKGADRIADDSCAILLQSNLGLGTAEEDAILNRAQQQLTLAF